jgi:hypothetical protein
MVDNAKVPLAAPPPLPSSPLSKQAEMVDNAKAPLSTRLPPFLLLSLREQATDRWQCQGTVIRTAATTIVVQVSKGGTTDDAKALLSASPPPQSLSYEQVEAFQ